ncbi:MAG: galactose mutarotase [Blautia sp.]|nr:galactose mutarotase [Blautia sp.]
MSVAVRKFGNLSTGEGISIYHIENSSGAYIEAIPYGAILVKVCVPDRNNELKDVVLGYDDPAQYEVNGCFFGATIGRNGNRIANAAFTIGGKEYHLAVNENCNNLHSGPNGFEKKMWDVTVPEEGNSVVFSRVSPDGENGFPGEFCVSVTYTLTDDNTLCIHYEGTSDQDTVANLTNHSYFNLHGEGCGKVTDQILRINASCYTPVCDSAAIPTGEAAKTAGTPMDFTEFKPIGRDIGLDFDQLKYTGGFDHNYVTDDYAPGKVRVIAEAYSEKTGIAMEVSSDLPCVQFYAGNAIGEEKGKNGHVYRSRDGFCLETQTEPNSVNQEGFHSPVISAGEKYQSTTAYRFFVK